MAKNSITQLLNEERYLTQNLREEVVKLSSKITELEEKLKNTSRSRDDYLSERRKLQEELSEISLFLDALPNAPIKSFKSTNSWGGTEEKELNILTRLAVWAASVSNG